MKKIYNELENNITTISSNFVILKRGVNYKLKYNEDRYIDFLLCKDQSDQLYLILVAIDGEHMPTGDFNIIKNVIAQGYNKFNSDYIIPPELLNNGINKIVIVTKESKNQIINMKMEMLEDDCADLYLYKKGQIKFLQAINESDGR